MCVGRCAAVLLVQSVSGKMWKFPIVLIASKPQVKEEPAVGPPGEFLIESCFVFVCC